MASDKRALELRGIKAGRDGNQAGVGLTNKTGELFRAGWPVAEGQPQDAGSRAASGAGLRSHAGLERIKMSLGVSCVGQSSRERI